MSGGPLFIGGLAHSGKTLLRLCLAAHPSFALTRRSYLWPDFYNRFGSLAEPANLERCLAAMWRHRPIREMVSDIEPIRQAFWQGEPSYGRLFALIHEQHARRVGRARWGEQVGLIERYADAIFAAYPDARMLHMLRDPRAQFEAAAHTMGRGALGRLTSMWRYSVALAARNQQRYPDRYRIIRYEALRDERAATLRAICHFLDEPFVPAMLDVVEEEDHAGGMGAREVAFLQGVAGRQMTAHAYPLAPVRLSWGERLRLACMEAPLNLAHMAAWRLVDGLRYNVPARLGYDLLPGKVG